MMPRKPTQQKETSQPQLVIPKQEAEKGLRTQIERGCEIRQRDYKTASDLQVGRQDKDKWTKYSEGAWKMGLVQELRHAGIDIDLNKLLP